MPIVAAKSDTPFYEPALPVSMSNSLQMSGSSQLDNVQIAFGVDILSALPGACRKWGVIPWIKATGMPKSRSRLVLLILWKYGDLVREIGWR
jgi:hypothetical protein